MKPTHHGDTYSANRIDSNNRSRMIAYLYHFLYDTLFGIAGKLKLRNYYHRLVDRIEGIDTAGDIWQTGSEFNGDTARKYGPGGWWDLKLTIGKKYSKNDVFIDFGSGKGRMVYLAARYFPIKKVIGVELSKDLNNIADENIRKNRHKLLCPNVQLVTANVSEYRFPDDVTIVYFYDPFREDLFIKLIQRLRTSLDRSPRKLRIIYRNPVMHQCIIDNGFRVALKKRSLTMYEANSNGGS